jgi:hypothetical protein
MIVDAPLLKALMTWGEYAVIRHYGLANGGQWVVGLREMEIFRIGLRACVGRPVPRKMEVDR